MILAIIGATGLVGAEIIKILEEQNRQQFKEILFVASNKSVGKKIKYKNHQFKIKSIKEAIKKQPNYALFSAGSKVSLKYAESFSKKGTIVVDNSSAFRMNKKIKLIVPEINKQTLTKKDKIIANPNCSTTQLVLAIHRIHKNFKIKRIVVSTYQSVSGSGWLGVKQLEGEEKNKKQKKKAYKKTIHRNIIPKCDDYTAFIQ